MKNRKLLSAIAICTLLLAACSKPADHSPEPTDAKDDNVHSETAHADDESADADTDKGNPESEDYKAGNLSAENSAVENPEEGIAQIRELFQPIQLNNTYLTRYGTINQVTCPRFQFDYPDSWTIIEETINDNFIDEKDVISNDRGVTISYTDYLNIDTLGGGGRTMIKMEVSRAADSVFIPGIPVGTNSDHSNLGNFMVARVAIVGELFMDTDSDYTAVDGQALYAVVPESYAGTHEAVGLTGIYQCCSFKYPQAYTMIAEAPDRQFTAEEEKEVIAILSSFRPVQ